ncbi:P27 family phage terminase small subunit [Aureimonas sp. SK2]|uniref:P27 family phage terminase small subunit n=1 Tax=Aureimonas sp. SK2 TaxID=3015992 RepID=UPI002443D8AE|nr:P27 family phage terminase small subunit [Aureimonas sp. SK2]
MGRRRDDPALQAAKGYPGRRKKATDRQIEAAAVAAEQEVVSQDPFAVPSVFLKAPAYYARAISLWRSQAQTLQAGGRRRPGYRGALTRYCMWTQIHEAAMDQLRRDCPKGNLVTKWTPVGGEERMIPHPSLKIMAQAEPILRAIEDDFGFTPRSDSALARVESFNLSQQRDLFSSGPVARSAPEQDATAGSGNPSDLMNDADTMPPVLN